MRCARHATGGGRTTLLDERAHIHNPLMCGALSPLCENATAPTGRRDPELHAPTLSHSYLRHKADIKHNINYQVSFAVRSLEETLGRGEVWQPMPSDANHNPKATGLSSRSSRAAFKEGATNHT